MCRFFHAQTVGYGGHRASTVVPLAYPQPVVSGRLHSPERCKKGSEGMTTSTVKGGLIPRYMYLYMCVILHFEFTPYRQDIV